ncbi:MAG: nucleotide-diphospho-sugar transferase [Spirochaetales bacterium]|nr:glycosyl transferase [Leptospiraceae bacterium]MCP5482104.1 nucleotide-diphospho-sugar transferase [Spirochaetales bacterium]MCP5484940.1 nucleotide-diphospho-sugar transferase [Spirochaetales bacterium]
MHGIIRTSKNEGTPVNPDPQEVPVLLIVFNRPAETAAVLDVLAQMRPRRVFVAADGPRAGNSLDLELCTRVREMVRDKVHWKCELETRFLERNAGCRMAVSGAINWFFEAVESGIILEDDTVPDVSFFSFCSELLEVYRHDDRVHMISGDNFQDGILRGRCGYYFTQFAHIWGWATWRNRWQEYDVTMKDWPAYRETRDFRDRFSSSAAFMFWKNFFDSVRSGKTDTWDAQWVLAAWLRDRLSIVPETNLVTNIGFSGSATHTLTPDHTANLPRQAITQPLRHSSQVAANRDADLYTERKLYSPTWRRRISGRVRSMARIVGLS